MFFNEIKNTLKTQWTTQLYKEYENICYQYRIKLKKPLIVIDELTNCFGLWNSLTKTITISDELPQKYSWDIVTGILKHEMAHQIVSDIFLSRDIHQRDFLRACELIGVPKEFCKATINIDQGFSNWRNEKNVQEDEVILRKMEKLLSLAQSTNEHEAFSAMEKVQELYTKYNITKLEEGLKSEFYSLIINFNKKKIPALHSVIVSILQNHYFVQVIYSELYNAQKNENHKIIDISGTKHNVLMAEYVFFFLVNRADYLWKNYKKENKISTKYKNSYTQGLINGFHNKLDKIRSEKNKKELNIHEQQTDIHTLMIIENQRLKEFTRRKFPRLVTKNSSGSALFRDHYDEGKKDGQKIILNKGMSSSSNSEKRLLT